MTWKYKSPKVVEILNIFMDFVSDTTFYDLNVHVGLHKKSQDADYVRVAQFSCLP